MLAFVAADHEGRPRDAQARRPAAACPTCFPWDPDEQLVLISVTASRAKTRNLQADLRATLHVTSRDLWTWVAVEGTAELSPVTANPARHHGR